VKVLVAGGGIGGLSLALSLHAAGLDGVEVFEATPVVEELGVGIMVLPHAVRELTELGVADDVAAAGLATGELVMFNKHGQRIWGEPRGLGAGYRWPQYSIHRGRLLGVLHRAFLDRLGAKRMHTGRRVVRCSQDGASVRVEFADGGVAEGDVLVGADGVHSTIRTQLHPDEGPPLWNGITMWRAVARAEPFLSGATMAIVGHFGKRAVIYPITPVGSDGRALINIVLEAKTTEGRAMPRHDWNHAVNRDEVRALFGSMRFDWIDLGMLIETAEQWWQYPMVDRDPLPRWSFGRVTLLGDAAHPMYPVGSNGASQAILDARCLADALVAAEHPRAALASPLERVTEERAADPGAACGSKHEEIFEKRLDSRRPERSVEPGLRVPDRPAVELRNRELDRRVGDQAREPGPELGVGRSGDPEMIPERRDDGGERIAVGGYGDADLRTDLRGERLDHRLASAGAREARTPAVPSSIMTTRSLNGAPRRCRARMIPALPNTTKERAAAAASRSPRRSGPAASRRSASPEPKKSPPWPANTESTMVTTGAGGATPWRSA
jgi:2-polyprenyl-6-methoxyphenol hydroxylase-like FAD-dependent oxidoreductase